MRLVLKLIRGLSGKNSPKDGHWSWVFSQKLSFRACRGILLFSSIFNALINLQRHLDKENEKNKISTNDQRPTTNDLFQIFRQMRRNRLKQFWK